MRMNVMTLFFFNLFFFFFAHFYFPASGQAVDTGVVPSSPRFLPSIFIARRVQQSHCSSIFHRVLLTHALALSATQFVHKKKSQRIYTSMHSAGLELTKLTYTRLEVNLIRHRGDRLSYMARPRRLDSHPGIYSSFCSVFYLGSAEFACACTFLIPSTGGLHLPLEKVAPAKRTRLRN